MNPSVSDEIQYFNRQTTDLSLDLAEVKFSVNELTSQRSSAQNSDDLVTKVTDLATELKEVSLLGESLFK